MKKVLIVDDEMLVRIGLKTMISWSDYGFTVVGEAQNGREALSILEENEVDLIITDISMPIMDGLELLKAVKTSPGNENIDVVILTHYKDFEYARTALSYGVSNYILKSELNPKTLIKSLEVFSTSNKQLGNNPSTDNNDKFSTLLKFLLNDKFNSETEYSSYLIENEIENNYNEYYLFGGNIFLDNIQDIDNIQKKSQVVEHIIEDTFTGSEYDIFCYSNGKTFLSLICLKNEYSNLIKTFKSNIFLLKESLNQLLNTTPLISEYFSANNLDSLFFLNKTLNEKKIKIYFENETASKEKVGSNFSVDMKYIYSLLLKENQKELNQYLELIFSFLFSKKDIYFAYKTLYKIDILLKETMSKSGKNSFAPNNLSLNKFCDKNSFTEHKAVIIDHLKAIYQIDKTSNLTSYIINKALEYIEKNYTQDITLTEIAEHLDISSGYLSSLFKREVNYNLKSYINTLRIDKAKEILLNSNDKVYYIAYKVGYSNPHYFSKIFKELTGLTCKEYRNMYSKQYS